MTLDFKFNVQSVQAATKASNIHSSISKKVNCKRDAEIWATLY